MWMLAILGAIGAALAAGRREQRGPTATQGVLAAAREDGTFPELRETLRAEGEAIKTEYLATLGPEELMAPQELVYPAVEPWLSGPMPPEYMPPEYVPYPVINGGDGVVTSADRASVRYQGSRTQLLSIANPAWV